MVPSASSNPSLGKDERFEPPSPHPKKRPVQVITLPVQVHSKSESGTCLASGQSEPTQFFPGTWQFCHMVLSNPAQRLEKEQYFRNVFI
jgi:hypothetical protein